MDIRKIAYEKGLILTPAITMTCDWLNKMFNLDDRMLS